MPPNQSMKTRASNKGGESAGDTTMSCLKSPPCSTAASSSKKRKANDSLEKENSNPQGENNWEQLYKALEAERVTKAESLLYAYRQESEERERLMRSYNQELEQDNQRLKQEAKHSKQQQQQIQDLQQWQAKAQQQQAMVRIYQAMTGATLVIPTTTSTSTTEDSSSLLLDCECTMTNSDTQVSTTFRLSTVPTKATTSTSSQSANATANAISQPSGTLLTYQPVQNADPLPEFLHSAIEFESSQLPPLLQNILRGIFPEEE